jgi:hypothetical protein
MKNKIHASLMIAFLASCTSGEEPVPIDDENPESEIYKIPVVVHVIHQGEPIGEGNNLSFGRIYNQIENLNNDYRKKIGTRGYNDHPDGGDSKIEFVLARQTPEGLPTDGIVRVNSLNQENPVDLASTFDYFAYYGYWDPSQYLNIWTAPFHEATNLFLGLSTGPETDLPGNGAFSPGEPLQAEGVIINAIHFGESQIASNYNLGRTLTHEIGHYLGLLHTWGLGECEQNDYCEDTPKVDEPVTECRSYLGCDESEVQIQNYMNWSPDSCMSMFTNDQIDRMRYVLENSPNRKSLLTSIGLEQPQ